MRTGCQQPNGMCGWCPSSSLDAWKSPPQLCSRRCSQWDTGLSAGFQLHDDEPLLGFFWMIFVGVFSSRREFIHTERFHPFDGARMQSRAERFQPQLSAQDGTGGTSGFIRQTLLQSKHNFRIPLSIGFEVPSDRSSGNDAGAAQGAEHGFPPNCCCSARCYGNAAVCAPSGGTAVVSVFLIEASSAG